MDINKSGHGSFSFTDNPELADKFAIKNKGNLFTLDKSNFKLKKLDSWKDLEKIPGYSKNTDFMSSKARKDFLETGYDGVIFPNMENMDIKGNEIRIFRDLKKSDFTKKLTFSTKELSAPGFALEEQVSKFASKEAFLKRFDLNPSSKDMKDPNFDIDEWFEEHPQQKAHAFLKTEEITPDEYDEFRDLYQDPEKKKKVDEMARYLIDNKDRELPPIWVNETGNYFPQVRDGHHRATAYILAGRERIPVWYDTQTLEEIWTKNK